MHWPALARTQQRTRCTRTRARNRRTPLKNRLARHRSSRYWPRSADWNTGLHRWWRGTQRGLVHRPRPGLWNDHARRGRRSGSRWTRRNRSTWRSSARRYHWRGCRRRCLYRRRGRRGTHRHRRRNHGCRCRRRRNHRSRRRNRSSWRRGHRSCRRRSDGLQDRRRDYCGSLCWSMRHRRCRRTRRHWRRYSFLLLSDCPQHIPGTGNVRQIDLGLDLFFAATRARTRLAGCRRTLRRGAEVYAYLLRFVLFQRTGVRFLFSHSDQRKRIENSFALYFQLSGKIVNSNLTHPAFRFSVL
jgi:hypothetical protein